jgi:sugar phosphate isomerase/epimerase
VAKRIEETGSAAEKLGWRLGMQAWTFHMLTFYEAVDRTASLGLHYIEAFPGQKLSPQKPAAQLHHAMAEELRREALAKLKASGVKLVCYGVVGLPNDEAECRKVFDFAREMGIETIVSEPAADALKLVDKLANEYGIDVAIHNHPKPSSPYWNPDTVVAACKALSKRIGSCSDTGHWMRSDVNPLDALKKLEGRIRSLHFKDITDYGPEAHDVPFGTGKGDVRAMLTELRRQGVKAVFSLEYEYNWLNSMPEIAQCVETFNRIAGELSKQA